MEDFSKLADLIQLATTSGQSNTHLMYVDMEDLKGQSSSDPKDLRDHYRIPLMYRTVTDKDGEQIEHPNLGPKDEFVISKEFAQTNRGKELCKQFAGIENAPESVFRNKNISNKRMRDVVKIKLIDVVYMKIGPLSKKRKTDKSKKKEKKNNLSVSNGMSKARAESESPSPSALVATLPTKKFVVSYGSLSSLKPGEYLNDEIMDFGMHLSLQKYYCGPSVVHLSTYIWATYFFRQPADGCDNPYQQKLIYNQIKDTTGDDLTKAKYLVIPVNRERHWMLAVICCPFPNEAICDQILSGMKTGDMKMVFYAYHAWLNGDERPIVFMFDSLFSSIGVMPFFHLNTFPYLTSGLHGLHQIFWRKKTGNDYPQLFDQRDVIGYSLRVPQQNNKADCGIFCMAYLHFIVAYLKERKHLDFFSTDTESWFSPDVEHLRERLFEALESNCKQNFPDMLVHVENLKVELFGFKCAINSKSKM